MMSFMHEEVGRIMHSISGKLLDTSRDGEKWVGQWVEGSEERCAADSDLDTFEYLCHWNNENRCNVKR